MRWIHYNVIIAQKIVISEKPQKNMGSFVKVFLCTSSDPQKKVLFPKNHKKNMGNFAKVKPVGFLGLGFFFGFIKKPRLDITTM